MKNLFPRSSIRSIILLLVVGLAVRANPPAGDPEQGLQNTLLVQRALEQARLHLFEKGDSRKAVEILEEHLPRINGNATYLKLLRDAYRTYIKDLLLVRQGGMARKYLERLSILDRSAVNDPALKVAGGEDKTMARPTTVRAKLDDDPFDPAYRLNMAPTPGKVTAAAGSSDQARQYLTRADVEFSERRYAQAKSFYEMAYQADQSVTADSRQRWGYCKLSHVVEQLKQKDLPPQSLSSLQQEVRLAMEMSPGLKDTGTWLLREIDRRSRTAGDAAFTADGKIAVRHLGRNAQGWQVAETTRFRILHNQSPELVEKVATVAERTAGDMHRKWFGGEAAAWNPKCDLVLHATANDYTRLTGVAGHSPGHSRMEIDTGGRVAGRRMDLRCDMPGMLEAVLPHETTHVVLAGQFGRHHVPRWADEGMAVLSEPRDKIEQHRRNLVRNQRDLFTVRDLMNLQEYPQPRRISTFYAQSVVLVDFLSQQRGPQVFAAFLREGLDRGYEAALQKHYGYRGFDDLQVRWNQQLRAEIERQGAVAGR